MELMTSQDHSSTVDNPLHARLHDSKIEEWLAQEGKYAMPPPSNPDSKLEGGIRLVISEREYYRPPSFSMSQQSYLRIEKEFNLPQATLHALNNESGMFSRYLDFDKKEPDKLLRIGMYVPSYDRENQLTIPRNRNQSMSKVPNWELRSLTIS
jgi:hypothetical protein